MLNRSLKKSQFVVHNSKFRKNIFKLMIGAPSVITFDTLMTSAYLAFESFCSKAFDYEFMINKKNIYS